MMIYLNKRLSAFWQDERGGIVIESLLTMPLLIWTMVAIYVYYDVFYTINILQRASYSIGDLMSRQELVTEEFVAGQQEILAFLTQGAPLAAMRITSLEFDEGATVNAAWDSDDKYDLIFSRSSDPAIVGLDAATLSTHPRRPHTQASLQALRTRIPTMTDGESVVLVETWVRHVPRFDTGIFNTTPGLEVDVVDEELNEGVAPGDEVDTVESGTYTNFIVTRARKRRVCMQDVPTCVG
jgi:Flp pilus assembly protein TadG